MSLEVRKQIISLIKNKRIKNIAIAMHNNPDGDCIGSAVALEEALIQNGKRVDIILQSKVAKKFAPIIGSNRVDKYMIPYEGKHYDVIFILDVADYERTYSPIQNMTSKIVIIDHHLNNNIPKVNYYLNENDASTGMTIYKLIKFISPITPKIATAIYLTIRSDTSNFKNSNTNSKTHSMAAELLIAGADIKEINNIYDDKSISYIKLMGTTLNNIKIDTVNKIAYLIISKNDIAFVGSNMREAGLIIDLMKTIENVEVALLFIENTNQVAIKARSKSFDVCQIMKEFGGGGHKCSAGCMTLSDDVYRTKEKVLDHTIKTINKR